MTLPTEEERMVTGRKFVSVLGVGAVAAPLASFAQQQGRVWRIGLLRAAGCACATAVLVSLPQLVMAQGSFPDKPIRLIVPTAAGAGQDIVARLIAQKLNEALGQPVVVDNRPGANGVVATELVARAPADGSVIAVGNSGTHAINATLYRKLPYDPVRDFAAISEVVSSSPVMVASPRVAANSIRELIAEAKKAPGKFNIAVVGATGEIAGNALKLQAGIDLNNIWYKGGAPGTIALLSGESHLMLTNYASVSTQVEAGKLKLLGVTGARRVAQLPNVPTFAENGLDGFEIEMWYGLFAPSRTPAAIVQTLYREVARIVSVPDVRDRLVAGGYNIVASTPEQFSERVKREVEKFRKIILDSGMQQE
jgi:tripartite-type tricarboxylate transporter receptor subunit TctC